MRPSQIAIASIAGVIAIVGAVMVGRIDAKNAKNRIVVDAGERGARIEIDGKPVGTVGKGGHAAFEIAKGAHAIRAVHDDGSIEETKLDVPAKFYRGLYRLRGAKPVALVSVAYGHCSSYYNSGHGVYLVGTNKLIDQPGMIALPSEPPLLELPKALYVESFDQPFSETFPLKRTECGWLSTHLCHVNDDGEPACAGTHGEHATKPEG